MMSTDTAWVFLHGGQHGSWCWSRLLAQLSPQERARAVLLDVPGCGSKRERRAETPTLEEVAIELNTQVQAAALGPAILVGHSMAGSLLPSMAALEPQLYQHLVYLSACLPRRGESVLTTMGQSVAGVDPSVVGWPLDPATTAPADLMAAMFGPSLDAHTLQALLHEVAQDQWPMSLAGAPVPLEGRDVAVPSSYVVTLQDPILPVAWQGRFAERAHARALYTLDAPHETFLSHPAELAAVLQRIAAAAPVLRPA
jgi:pimeloyl-ACP methyl ester carboxylesterase